jgi:microcompartment protein CcmK/EutM
MHLGEVIGTVVCTQKVDSWKGQRLRLVQPISQDGEDIGHPLVALDTVSSDAGQWVFFVRSREAAHAIENVFNPADAAIVALVDRLEGPGAGKGRPD